MKKRYLFIPIALFIVIAGIFMLQLLRNAQGERPTDLESRLIGKPLPDFKLIGLEPGKVYERSDLINGEPFLLTVWATWCPSCYEEHHFLNTLARQGTRIIGIDSKKDPSDTKERERAVAWLAQLQNPFVINLFDETGTMALDLGVYGAPETFFVDSQGIIRYRLAGPMNPKIWDEVFVPLFQQYGSILPEVQTMPAV